MKREKASSFARAKMDMHGPISSDGRLVVAHLAQQPKHGSPPRVSDEAAWAPRCKVRPCPLEGLPPCSWCGISEAALPAPDTAPERLPLMSVAL